MACYHKRTTDPVCNYLPADERAYIPVFVGPTDGRLHLYFWPDFTSEIRRGELAYSRATRAGAATCPLRVRKDLRERVREQPSALQGSLLPAH